MNLTLTDLLTPAQIEQAHNDLADTMLALDNEEIEAINRVHHEISERRREARREAILKVLLGGGEFLPSDVSAVKPEPEVVIYAAEVPAVEEPLVEEIPSGVQAEEPSYVLPQDDPVAVGAWQQEEADRTAIRLPSPGTPKTSLLTAPPEGCLTKAQAANRLRISGNDFKLLVTNGHVAPSGEYEYRAGMTSQYFTVAVLDEYLQARKQRAAAAKAAKATPAQTPTPKLVITPEPEEEHVKTFPVAPIAEASTVPLSVALASSEPSFGARLKAAQAVAREGLKLEYYKQRKGFVLAHRMADDSWRHSILGTPLESGWAAVVFFEMEGGRCVPVQGISMRNGLIGEIGKHLADSYKNQGRV